MAVTWTEEQKKVIDTRNCDILVSAAAGSGKTAVLVARILALITDEKRPVDIDRLLVVTFTNAAAADTGRVGKTCGGGTGQRPPSAAACAGTQCEDYYDPQLLPACAPQPFPDCGD